ncbi:MAG: glycosyltransferase [Sneathiella sp.]
MSQNYVEKLAPDIQNSFDGVICFGGVDWWYHNRGHYDLQMMREFSEKVPVLYVNSIGMRPPNIVEGAMFFTRIRRKLKSLGHGLVNVRSNFSVFSPVTIPGGGKSKFGIWMAKVTLSFQVRWAAKKCGITRPLVWVACPPGASIVEDFRATRIIYQRTDRFEDFKGVDKQKIIDFDVKLKQVSDAVLFCSRELFVAEKDQNRNSQFIDHGVDFEKFEAAALAAESDSIQPVDMKGIASPRIGFIGGIDIHTFDPELFLKVVQLLPEFQFVMIGACSLDENWCPYENVHFLGQKPYEEVPSYMAACDILIMPWNKSDWIRACNPVKMKEYLAIGKPIVSTYFPEVEYFKDHILVATEAEEFATALRDSLSNLPDPKHQRERVRQDTWAAKANEVWKAVT